MTEQDHGRVQRLIIWGAADQAALVMEVARAGGHRIAAVGGPAPADAAALAAAVPTDDEVPPPARFHDLRHVVSTLGQPGASLGEAPEGVEVSSADRAAHAARAAGRDGVPDDQGAGPAPAIHRADGILVAARGPLEADERAVLRSARIPVVSLEPRPARLAEFIADVALESSVRTPRLSAGAAWRLASEAITDFGRIALLEIGMAGRPEEGSTHARLHDAMDVLDRLVSRPTRVAAGMDRGPGDVPEHLAGLRGALTVEVRGDDGWCASIACTDAAPAWGRRVTATGPAGRFVLDDDGFTWTGPDGSVLERLEVDGAGGAGAARPRIAAGPRAIAEALTRAAGDERDRASRGRRVRRFALCEAARLAARTGERESPGRLAEVLGGEGDG